MKLYYKDFKTKKKTNIHIQQKINNKNNKILKIKILKKPKIMFKTNKNKMKMISYLIIIQIWMIKWLQTTGSYQENTLKMENLF
jgi:hypothetical protein